MAFASTAAHRVYDDYMETAQEYEGMQPKDRECGTAITYE